MAARNESGADKNKGKDRMRSTRSSGISGNVDAVRGEGRTGRVGFVSRLNDLIKDRESGIGAPFPLNGEGPPRLRLMLVAIVLYCNVSTASPPCLSGLSALEQLG